MPKHVDKYDQIQCKTPKTKYPWGPKFFPGPSFEKAYNISWTNNNTKGQMTEDNGDNVFVPIATKNLRVLQFQRGVCIELGHMFIQFYTSFIWGGRF